MERSEPTLVPEWLKATPGSSTSNISSSNSSLHPSSSLRSGQRNKLAVSSSDHDFRRSASLVERTSSSLSRRSVSSNGSGTHGKTNLNSSRSYLSSRRNRDKCLDRELDHHEKERLLDNGYLDSLLVGSAERAALQRSKSLVARKPTDSWPKKGNNDTTTSSISVRNSISSVGRSSFEREFPSLVCEEKPSSPEITRVSSPALITVPQIPLLSSSTVIGGEGWTSCLADVPSRIASNGALHASVIHSAPVSSVLVTPTASSSLNMAETVAQAPLRARTIPQLSVETQRLEELAIKQSKQLIPMTPSLPKTLASNLSDKSKSKGTRAADASGISKGITQASSLLSHPHRGTPRSDVPKNPQVGNFQVLNREKNCLSPTAKEVQNLTNGTRIVSMHGVTSSVNALPKKTSNLLRKSDLKGSEPLSTNCPNLDKRPSPQAQDRNDFFNSLRKKAPVSNSTAWQQNYCSSSSSAAENSNDQHTSFIASDCPAIDSSASFLDYSGSGRDSLNENCEGFFKEPESSHQNQEKGENYFHGSVVPEEKEFEFLRSLGWVEDDGEEAITPEEIASFYSKLRKQVTSPELNLPESMNKVEAAAQEEESSSCNSGEA